MSMSKSMNSLAPLALAIVSLVILVATGGIILTEMQPTSYAEVDTTAEADQPSTPLPANYTLDGSTTSDYVQVSDTSVEVTYEDSSAGTNTTLTEGTDYEVYYEAGEVEVQNTSTTTDYDSTTDQYYTDYTYEEEGTATATLGQGQDALQTFSDFFQIIVVVGVAGVIFLLLGGLKRAGGRTMA